MKPTEKYFNRVAIMVILFSVALVVGCSMKWKQGKCKQWGVCQTEKDSIHIKDSTYLIPIPYNINADTAYVIAWMECDSVNRVVLRNYNLTNGKYIRLVQEIEEGKYTVWSYLPARTDTVFAPGKETVVYRYKLKNSPPVNILTKFQQFKNTAFWPLGVIVVLLLLYIIYRLYKWIKKKITMI